jgi:hypothetical protein
MVIRFFLLPSILMISLVGWAKQCNMLFIHNKWKVMNISKKKNAFRPALTMVKTNSADRKTLV